MKQMKIDLNLFLKNLQTHYIVINLTEAEVQARKKV